MPSIVPGLITTGVQTGLGLWAASRQQSQASDQQSREIGRAWEALIRRANAVIQPITRQTVITLDDYERAVREYETLETFVSQHGNEYVTAQWQSEDYQPAYISIIQQIEARAVQGAQPANGGGNTPIIGQLPEIGGINILWIVLGAVGVAWVLKN